MEREPNKDNQNWLDRPIGGLAQTVTWATGGVFTGAITLEAINSTLEHQASLGPLAIAVGGLATAGFGAMAGLSWKQFHQSQEVRTNE